MTGTERTGRPWKAAVLSTAGCSVLFLILYNLTNSIAAGREDVGTFAYAWETSIPLVPWLIVPYISIDVFFVIAPFFCTSEREIGVLTRRLCASIVIASVFFLAWPLELVFSRAPVEGMFGPIFTVLHGMDKPHNLFPSLHITLVFVLRWTYHRHARGLWRLFMHVWFALVTVSTLLTHQHQAVDILGGIVLGLFVFYLFPTGSIARDDAKVTGPPSVKLALRYAAGSLAAGALALSLALFGDGLWGESPLTWVLFWPLAWIALALGIVALGYGWLGPRVFRKAQGYLSIPARVFLAPYLIGLWLTRRWYFAKSPDFARITPEVILGRLPDRALVEKLERDGTKTHAVLDLCAEHATYRPLPVAYHFAPVMDLARPDAQTVHDAVEFLEREQAQGQVYVHCALGYERSGVVVAEWLARTGRVEGRAAAAERVAAARPGGVSAARLQTALESLGPSR